MKALQETGESQIAGENAENQKKKKKKKKKKGGNAAAQQDDVGLDQPEET